MISRWCLLSTFGSAGLSFCFCSRWFAGLSYGGFCSKFVMGCGTLMASQPADGFTEKYLHPLREKVAEQAEVQADRRKGGAATSKPFVLQKKINTLNCYLPYQTEGHRGNSSSARHESFEPDTESKDRSPRGSVLQEHSSAIRKATLQNLLSSEGDFVHLHGKLIFLEQTRRPLGENTPELIRVL